MSVASPERYLADLNPAQREAVLTTEGPLLVIAGAGSGKTRVLTHRVAHLLATQGVKPNEILAITFTNKAAGEMRERLERMLGPIARAIWILTFHAACGRILRREAQRLGYRSNFTIYDQADQVRLVKQCLEELERDPKRFTPRGIHSVISREKNNLVGPDAFRERVASFYDQTVADVYELYQRKLFASNAVDFDDLLYLTVDVLERFPEAQERWRKAFRYVLVDEYQDTNHAQYRLLQLLASEHRNLCAVGDPDQSIYAFRGADIRNILDFERDFPGTRTIALEQNYRSTNSILRAANNVIENNRERKPKHLFSDLGEGDPVEAIEVEDEHAEARFVAARVAALVEEGFSGSEIAVFYRMNAQSRVLEDVLVRQGVAYQVIGGPRFYERAEIKDLIAYLQVLDNPADAVSLMRIANKPRRGIGDSSIARLVTFADAQGIWLWHALARADEAGVGAAPLKNVRALNTLLQSLAAQAQELSVPELVERVLEQSGYLAALEAERTIEAQGRMENLQELVERRARVPGERGRAVAVVVPAGDLALLGPGRDPRRRLARHADDAAQREGPRVPRGVRDRHGGGALSARARGRGAGGRGGAAARVRRPDACAGAALPHARVVAHAVRQPRVQPAVAFPRRAARARCRARAAGAREVGLRPQDRRRSTRCATTRRSAPATRSGTRRSARASSSASTPARSSRSASRTEASGS